MSIEGAFVLALMITVLIVGMILLTCMMYRYTHATYYTNAYEI